MEQVEYLVVSADSECKMQSRNVRIEVFASNAAFAHAPVCNIFWAEIAQVIRLLIVGAALERTVDGMI